MNHLPVPSSPPSAPRFLSRAPHPLLTVGLMISLVLNGVLLSKTSHLEKQYSEDISNLHKEISTLREDTSKEISNSVWELEEIINRQTSLISDFNYHIQPEREGKIKLMLTARLKSHKDGQIVSFTVDSGNGQQRILTTLSDNVLSSQVVFPLKKSLTIGLVISDQYSSKTETLAELNNIPEGLTSHLTITPSISMEHSNTDTSARVSGEVYLINEKGAMASRALNTYMVELVYNGTVLHSIPFESVTGLSTSEGDEVYYVNIQPYPIPMDTDGTLSLIAHATDMEGFEYSCTFEQYSITAGGGFTPVSGDKRSYFTIDN